MKKLGIVLLVVVALVAGAVVMLPRLVPMERIEAEAKSKFREATGRELAYGSMRFNLWPNLGLRLRDVTVSNPDWAQADNMLTLAELDVSLAARALLDRKVEIKRFNLKAPVINLEKAKDGKASWTLGGTAAQAANDGGTTEGAAGGNALQDFSVSLGEFKITDGSVTYIDGPSGKTQKAEDVDITLIMPTLNSAMNLDGGADYLGKRVNVVLGLEQPMELVNGKSSQGSLNLRTDDLTAEVAGALSTSGTLLKGRVNADVKSLPNLLAWLGGTEPAKLPVTTFSLASNAEVTDSTLKFTGATVAADEIKGGGDITVKYGAARPDIHARLSVDKVNLDRFLGDKTGQSDADAAGKTAASGGQAQWDDSAIDFSALKGLDADMVLQTKGYAIKGVDVGPSTLTVLLKGGNLNFKSSEASLFSGTFGSDVNLNASGANPTMSFKFKMDGVEAKPLLANFADFDKLSGKMDGNVNVSSSGNSQRAIISALNGSGGVTFRNGAIEGIDIVNIAQGIQKRLGEMGVGGGKTDFVELGGTFTIVKGIAHNEDLSLKGPLVQATGKGDVNLPAKSIQYRVIPVLTASSGVDNAAGIKVPVDITGPFNNIKVRPDYASVLKNALENPEDLKKTLKQAEDSLDPLKDNIKGLRKGIKEDPAKAIEGLLQGGGIGGLLNKKPASVPASEPAPAPAATPAPSPSPAPAATAAPAPAEAPAPAPEAAPAPASEAPPAPAQETAPAPATEAEAAPDAAATP